MTELTGFAGRKCRCTFDGGFELLRRAEPSVSVCARSCSRSCSKGGNSVEQGYENIDSTYGTGKDLGKIHIVPRG